jgi:thioredoxin 1
MVSTCSIGVTIMMITELTETTFSAFVAHESRSVLVEFWGAGCSRCRRLLPVLRELAVQYADRAAFAQVDVDGDAGLAAAFGVVTLPTVVLFRDGHHSTVLSGGGGKPELLAALDRCRATNSTFSAR